MWIEHALSLNVADVQKEDSGYYFCFSVKDGTPLYITYHVTVKSKMIQIILFLKNHFLLFTIFLSIVYQYH